MPCNALLCSDAGRRTRLLYGNSSYASYLYDDASRLTSLVNRKSDNNVISSFAYTVDDTGNRTRLTLSNGDYADYLYDDTYQLTREHRKDSGNSTLYYNNFYYDAAGNRTRLEYNDGGGTTTTTYLYNPADQLTRETVGETNTDYLYDANGSLTKKDDGTNVHSYAYDYRNLMTDYDGPGTSNDSTYKYDAFSRRITKDVNGTKTAYFHDGLNVVAEYNGSNQLQRTYVTPGLDSNVTMTASGSTYYYLTDALGSIRQLIDANEATQNSYDYFAFGKVYGTPTENLSQPFRFTARAWDPETELHYYRARNYEATTGRFSARDPMWPRADSSNYRYVSNSPTLYVDPEGLVQRPITQTEADLVRATCLLRKMGWPITGQDLGDIASGDVAWGRCHGRRKGQTGRVRNRTTISTSQTRGWYDLANTMAHEGLHRHCLPEGTVPMPRGWPANIADDPYTGPWVNKWMDAWMSYWLGKKITVCCTSGPNKGKELTVSCIRYFEKLCTIQSNLSDTFACPTYKVCRGDCTRPKGSKYMPPAK